MILDAKPALQAKDTQKPRDIQSQWFAFPRPSLNASQIPPTLRFGGQAHFSNFTRRRVVNAGGRQSSITRQETPHTRHRSSTLDRDGSKQLDELFNSEICLSDDGPERAAIEDFVFRNNQLSKRIIPAKDEVASMLPEKLEANFPKRFRAFSARDNRERTHTARSNASNFSGGTGRRSSCSAVIYASIASRILAIAFSLVSP
jgi:hypothetical protein